MKRVMCNSFKAVVVRTVWRPANGNGSLCTSFSMDWRDALASFGDQLLCDPGSVRIEIIPVLRGGPEHRQAQNNHAAFSKRLQAHADAAKAAEEERRAQLSKEASAVAGLMGQTESATP